MEISRSAIPNWRTRVRTRATSSSCRRSASAAVGACVCTPSRTTARSGGAETTPSPVTVIVPGTSGAWTGCADAAPAARTRRRTSRSMAAGGWWLVAGGWWRRCPAGDGCRQRVAPPISSFPVPLSCERSEPYGWRRPSRRGNGPVSRTCPSPQIQATVRSRPSPNPACGTDPYRRRSRYQSNALSGRPVRGDLVAEEPEIRRPLAAPDDLAVALGREHVHPEREAVVLRVALHVERLDGGRVAVDDDGPLEVPREDGLVGAAEVGAPLKGAGALLPLRDVPQALLDLVEAHVDLDLAGVDPPLLSFLRAPVPLAVPVALLFEGVPLVLQPLGLGIEHRLRGVAGQEVDGLGVAEARERGLGGRLQLAHVALEHRQLGLTSCKYGLQDRDQQLLRQLHVHPEVVERHLGLDHPELREVPAGLRLLGPERRPERVDLPVRKRHRLAVELARLREVGRLAEVVELEERGGPLDGVPREDRRVHLDEPLALEVGVDGLDDPVADAHGGPLAAAPEPEVPAVHEELDAVLFGRDRVRLGEREHLDARGLDLDPARLPLVGADRALDTERALLRQRLGGLPRLGPDGVRVHDDLHDPAPVADLEELQALRPARVVEPPVDGDGLADVLGEGFDADERLGHGAVRGGSAEATGGA